MRTSSSTRTFPFQLHGNYSLVTNAVGAGSIMFCPGWTYLAAFNTGVSGFDATYTNLSVTGNSLPTTFYRVVSAGYIVRKTVAPLSASGVVRIRTFDQSDGFGFGTVSFNDYNCAQFTDKPLADSSEIAIVAKVNDAPGQEKLKPPSTTNPTAAITQWSAPGLGAVQIAVTGAAVSSAVAEVEFYINYELVFADNEPLAQAGKTTPVANPLVHAAKAQMASSFETIARNGVSQFSSFVEKKAVEAVTSVLSPNLLFALP